jgi:surfactin synthase thioesterase subunit
LFCFPYAGGGASIYRTWAQNLWPLADVYAVQLPGREERINTPLFFDIRVLVQALLEQGNTWFTAPFALFGHSMGAKIAFELARSLGLSGIKPKLLFASASRPPNRPEPRRLHDLPDEQFIQELRHLSGTPEIILQNKEFMDMFKPILRADFAMDETYFENSKIDSPIVTIGAEQDIEVDFAELNNWKDLTNGIFTFKSIKGDHFFIKNNIEEVFNILKYELMRFS